MKRKLLKNCSVLDVVSQRVTQGQSILIEDDRIKKIGDAIEFGYEPKRVLIYEE